MDGSAQAELLTPLERIELRESLQDRWRGQMRLITLLSLHRDVAEREAGSPDPWLDASAAERAIHRARLRLASIESAMRRLDDNTYGWCVSCGSAIGVARLVHAPEEGRCDGCRAG
jgi:hypothetical protein